MPIKPIIENRAADFSTELDNCLSFAVENQGAVTAWLWFDESAAKAPVLPGTIRDFPYHGTTYSGEMACRFEAAAPGAVKNVIVTKIICIK